MRHFLFCAFLVALPYSQARAELQLKNEVPLPSRPGVESFRSSPPSSSLPTLASPQPMVFSAPCLDGAAIECQSLEDLVTKGYAGIGAPPDPNCAVGPTHVINATNIVIQWRTKDNPQDVPEFEQPLAYFFGLVDSPTEFAYTTDPKVIYDQYAGRFVLALIAGETIAESTWLLAVSKTSDPNDGWWLHSFQGNATVNGVTYYIDYPGLAVDDDAVYLTANMFNVTFTTYYGPFLWIIYKTPGAYDGDTLIFYNAYDLKGLNLSTTTTQPAHTFGSVPPGFLGRPFGTFLVSYGGLSGGGTEFVNVVSINDPLGTAGGLLFDRQVVSCGDIDNTAVSIGDAPQPGGPELIDALGRQVFNAVWRDNSLYFAADCRPPSGPDAGQVTAHWWRVRTTFDGTNTPALALADQGNIGAEDVGAGTFTYDPCVMVDAAGDLAVGFCASGPSVYAGAYFAARMPGDAPGTIGPTCLLAPGIDYYYRVFPPNTRNRWGDYTGLALCPVDESTFWIYNQYAGIGGYVDEPPSLGQGIWHTKLGKFHVSPTVSVAITAFAATASDGVVSLRGAFRSDLGVEAVNVYRGPEAGALLQIESMAQSESDFAYVDRDVTPGATYRYRIGVVDADGEFFSPVVTVSLDAVATALAPNRPNPFNPATTIPYSLAAPSGVSLHIYDAAGRMVRRLVDDVQTAGGHTASWDGRDDRGVAVASGVYFCRLRAGDVTDTRRMVLLK